MLIPANGFFRMGGTDEPSARTKDMRGPRIYGEDCNMSYETILTETVGRVGIVTLNRPERMNAVNTEMRRERREIFETWNEDPAIGAIVWTGAGRAFCSGADVGQWREAIAQREAGNGRPPRGPLTRESWTQFLMRSKPVICAFNGPAIGVGLSATLPCDIRIASERASFSMKFVKMGVFPELGSTHILPLLVGMGHALDLMLSGRFVDAREAERIGLVNRVVPHESLLDDAITTAQEIANNPPDSLTAIKRTTWLNVAESNIGEVHRRERAELDAAQARASHKEAVDAFLEKRASDLLVDQ